VEEAAQAEVTQREGGRDRTPDEGVYCGRAAWRASSAVEVPIAWEAAFLRKTLWGRLLQQHRPCPGGECPNPQYTAAPRKGQVRPWA
jgi:hypothetical protein